MGRPAKGPRRRKGRARPLCERRLQEDLRGRPADGLGAQVRDDVCSTERPGQAFAVGIAIARAGHTKVELLDSNSEIVRDHASSFVLISPLDV